MTCDPRSRDVHSNGLDHGGAEQPDLDLVALAKATATPRRRAIIDRTTPRDLGPDDE